MSIDSYLSGNICSLYNFDKYNVNKLFLMNYLIYNKPKTNNNAVPNISREIMNNIMIPIPSLDDQNKIITKIENLNNLLSQYESYNKIL